MNVVVNTNKRGSQVIITISDRRNEVNVRKNEFPVGDEMIEDTEIIEINRILKRNNYWRK